MRHDRDGDLPSADALQATFAAAPAIQHLLIERCRGGGERRPRADATVVEGSPLKRATLLQAVAVAAGRAVPQAAQHGDAAVAADQRGQTTIAQARAQGRLILVAEDDRINRNVILRQIELLGYAAEIAVDGAEALRLWRVGDYALLLTDLPMPEMDGYALAAAIRSEEAERFPGRTQRMPILALTANALRGEAVRAREAGMDEYLTKPLQLHLLRTALDRWLASTSGQTVPVPLDLGEAHRGTRPTAAVDINVLKGLVGDDAAPVRELLADYRTAAGRLAVEIRLAHERRDVRHIGSIAHKLKSSSRSVGALALGDVCAELENACRLDAWEGVNQCTLNFEAELVDVNACVDQLLEGV